MGQSQKVDEVDTTYPAILHTQKAEDAGRQGGYGPGATLGVEVDFFREGRCVFTF